MTAMAELGNLCRNSRTSFTQACLIAALSVILMEMSTRFSYSLFTAIFLLTLIATILLGNFFLLKQS